MSESFPFNDETGYTIPPRIEPAKADPPRPLTVTELTRKIKRLLETQIVDVLLEGEISGFKAASSGHMYFDLKDAGALIHCIMWAGDAARLRFKPANGAKVELRGRLTVYDQRGQYQLAVSLMRPAGLGKLYQAYLDMKERLAAEGLFHPSLKKPLPSHPRSVGIVTSPTGAAIQDMLHILHRRAPHIHILIWPVRVQGEGAADEIARAIRRFNQCEEHVDVLIVGRGGGSLEDLWAFNEEVVARAIADSELPVISAVGHETDTTIADFVADLRAPTPSAAAELVARDSAEILRHLALLQNRAVRALREHTGFLKQAPHLAMRLEAALLPRLGQYRGQLREFQRSYGLQMPLQRVNQGKQHYDNLLEQMRRRLTEQFRDQKAGLSQFDNQLRHLNPKAILKRGYSITYHEETGKIIQKKNDAPAGSPLKIILGQGEISAVVPGGSSARPRKKTNPKVSTSIADFFGTDTSENLKND